MNTWDKIKQERTGQQRLNKDGVAATVVEYINSSHVIIQYDKYGIKEQIKWERFDKGKFMTPTAFYAEKYVGQRRQNKNQEWATCVAYTDIEHVTIQFDVGHRRDIVCWGNFDKGRFGNKCKHNQFGGIYDINAPIKNQDGVIPKSYNAWHSILKRCYSDPVHIRRHSYEDCEINDEWKYYSKFLDWLYSQDNYEQWNIGGKNWHIDKDIKLKGNKIYGAQYCFLVPSVINGLLLKCDVARGDYPIGVYLDTTVNLYRAQCQNPYFGRQISLGYYETPEAAFYQGYKPYKEKVIAMVAEDEYKQKHITQECYDALLKYRVEITD